LLAHKAQSYFEAAPPDERAAPAARAKI